MSNLHEVNSKTNTENKDKAQAAINKPATAGQDIDLTALSNPGKDLPYQSDLSQIPDAEKQQMLEAGVVLDHQQERSGTFLQMDNTPVHFSCSTRGNRSALY